jgi:hypothetical protein
MDIFAKSTPFNYTAHAAETLFCHTNGAVRIVIFFFKGEERIYVHDSSQSRYSTVSLCELSDAIELR